MPCYMDKIVAIVVGHSAIAPPGWDAQYLLIGPPYAFCGEKMLPWHQPASARILHPCPFAHWYPPADLASPWLGCLMINFCWP